MVVEGCMELQLSLRLPPEYMFAHKPGLKMLISRFVSGVQSFSQLFFLLTRSVLFSFQINVKLCCTIAANIHEKIVCPLVIQL